MISSYQHGEKTAPAPQAVANKVASNAVAYPSVPAIQKKNAEEDELQMKPVTQLAKPEEDELQMKSANVMDEVSQRIENATPLKANQTGMPDQLKTGIENLSGFSMDDVKVHYNSDKPAQLNALAYAQGTNIHIAPGQERHLPHEAWHVVQQKQGRVRATMQMKGVAINDDKGLEKEADVMGGNAVQMYQEVFQRQEIGNNKIVFRSNFNMAQQNLAKNENLQMKRQSRRSDIELYGNDRVSGKSSKQAINETSVSNSVIQRIGESAETLKELATPKVFPGPEVMLQKEIVGSLESVLKGKNDDLFNVTCVGGIELKKQGDSDSVADMVKNAKLIELNKHEHALQRSIFNLIGNDEGVKNKIVRNTLATMHAAGQLDYLEKSNLINDQWKVIIEIHYYRSREAKTPNLHKDTLGQTLFVNLNYINNSPIPGPEYIVNPYSSDIYDSYRGKNLPPVFLKDLKEFTESQDKGTEFRAPEIPANGIVAFVDEAIHHMTPMLRHRKVSARQIVEKYPKVKGFYESYRSNPLKLFSKKKFMKSINDTNKSKDTDGWLQIMSKFEDEKAVFDRNELKVLLPNLPQLEIEALIEIGGHSQFGQASIPKFGKLPVKEEDSKLPLKRQMSDNLLKEKIGVPGEGEKRAFFRTWVRAVRKEGQEGPGTESAAAPTTAAAAAAHTPSPSPSSSAAAAATADTRL